MEFWFSELHTGNVKLSVRIEKQLFSGESEYQRIDVFDSEEFGKFISLDGEIVFSEKDEFIYDEMEMCIRDRECCSWLRFLRRCTTIRFYSPHSRTWCLPSSAPCYSHIS